MPSKRISDFIASSLWGKQLTKEQLQRVVSEASDSVAAAGETICHRGLRSEYWYGVMDGLVKVSNVSRSGRQATLIGIPTGGWFGEGSVLKYEIRPYDVVALRESHLALVPAATFHWLLNVSFPFNRFLIDQLNARLAQFVIRDELARSTDPGQHVAHCLVELFNAELYPEKIYTLKISQGELAFLAGVSRQLVNRTLHHLQEAKFLSASYGVIKILDVEALRAFAADTKN
jgi:CRP/FNR family cyclic AMP-dependent transcriptional regulator